MKKIVTILVPTDSSAVSRIAIQYALVLAPVIKARIVMVSVVEIQTDESVLQNWKKLETQMMRSAQKDIDKRVIEAKGLAGKQVDIEGVLIKGFPKHEIICKYAKDGKMDLIVMGTKGATGLSKILQGSIAAAVIGHSAVPVITVGAKTTFTKLKRIVYATDMKNLKEETKLLASIATLFQAEILILHVAGSKADSRIDKNLEPELIKLAGYGNISYHVVKSDNMQEAINTFIASKHADLLAMFTHKPDFYEKLFNKSMARKMAFQSDIPLLTFNKSTRAKKIVL